MTDTDQMKEWLVPVRVTFSGAYMRVMAADAVAARAAAEKGSFIDDIELGGASLSDWSVDGKPSVNE